MSRFRPIDRKTAYLLPPSVEDWLPEDHLARFIVEAMEKLNLNDLARAYAGRGSAAYHLEVMLGLLVYGYATGIFSSRKQVGNHRAVDRPERAIGDSRFEFALFRRQCQGKAGP